MYLTASKLYDFLQCPHRVWRDQYGPQAEKSTEANAFLQLLWERGVLYEEKVLESLGEFADMSHGTHEERCAATVAAMKAKNPMIYQGVLLVDNLLGIPDLLKLQADGTYIPIDIKSGMAMEGVDENEEKEGTYKKHYAVQLALYCDALQRLGFGAGQRGIIYDMHGNEVEYDLTQPQGVTKKETWWELYDSLSAQAIALMENKANVDPAMMGVCKVCPWYASCKKWAEAKDDPSCLFYVGRKNRDALKEDLDITTMKELVGLNIQELLQRKKKDKGFLRGMHEAALTKLTRRAKVMKVTKKPIAYEPIVFPDVTYELFFDIEDDPTQEFVYMHGVYERTPKGERYLDFTAKEVTPEAEKNAWADFWAYIDSLPQDDFAVYYYSHHEKTTYKKLQKEYSDVISSDKLEAFFDNPRVIDLYSVVNKYTDWPLGSYSVKAIAQYLGFSWRDKTPSGALSIEWFNTFIETKDQKILERILEYNEDDCKATMVVKDGVGKLGVL